MTRFTFLMALIGVAACSSAPTHWPDITEDSAATSSFKLRYVAGKNEYVLQAIPTGERFAVSSYLNKRSLERKFISQEQYLGLARRVSDFAREFHGKNEHSQQPCRMPFMIAVQQQGEVLATDGCRSEDLEGRLGRIIRDAEILFYAEEP